MSNKFKNFGKIVLYLLDALFDMALENLKIIKRNISLFLGFFLFLLGLLSFESDKYCDGNAANYLSCTRPTTYYYYGWWAVFLVVAGALLIALWALKLKMNKNR